MDKITLLEEKLDRALAYTRATGDYSVFSAAVQELTQAMIASMIASAKA